jgi:beta-galactosidase
LLLDFGWRFHLGHASDGAKDFGFGVSEHHPAFAKAFGYLPVTQRDFDESNWRDLNLPHDWLVELPLQNGPERPAHTYKPIGRDHPETSIGWYRRGFEIPAADIGKRICVEFDGVFRQATVWFNGCYIGENFSGYAPFRFDVTDYVDFGGKNILAVRVDATLSEGWFYESAGIYRHVWLTKTDPLHVTQWGTYVRPQVHDTSAVIQISTEVENEADSDRTCHVTSEIVDVNGKVVAARPEPATVPAWGRHTFALQVEIARPVMWSLEEPNLYTLVTSIEEDDRLADRTETVFGIRSIRFDSERGFFLNGKPVKIKGTCNHQDHAGVGSALPDRMHTYRIKRLKEMGSNAYRAAHNPPAPELLDACDRLGMLVMDETRTMASTPEGLSQLERMIRRDRNHPSVILWSLANEEDRLQGTTRGANIVRSMKRLVRKLDPSRPVTVAMNGAWGRGISEVVDVQGFNYCGDSDRGEDTGKQIDLFHAKFPRQPTIGTETASSYSTRGIYVDERERGYVTAYDLNVPNYGQSAESWWKTYDERPFVAGGFAWTGFDYRGESSPFNKWPSISSHFGVMDTCGFPKDSYFYYKAWWGSEPILHIFPHWNWAGREGQEIAVWCHTNLDGVELFLNGASLGSKRVERNSHLEWRVPYTAGVLEARGLKNGHVILSDQRETTGPPAGIALRPDRLAIAADGEDVSVVVAELRDAQDRLVPTACNEVHFQVMGSGRIIGVGNGDPNSHEADKPSSSSEGRRSAFNGLCVVIVQALKNPGNILIEAAAAGLRTSTTVIRADAAKLRPAVS